MRPASHSASMCPGQDPIMSPGEGLARSSLPVLADQHKTSCHGGLSPWKALHPRSPPPGPDPQSLSATTPNVTVRGCPPIM